MTMTSEGRAANEYAEAYPIRTVAGLTGVNPVTLRAWERRYGLIRPVRTAKGHRLYTRAHIDLINRILELLDKGMSIGQVRRALEAAGADQAVAPADVWAGYRERMLAAITRFDEAALEDVYDEVLSLHPIATVTTHVLLPLLETLGRRWASAAGTVAEEHFFGVYLRNKLGARFHHRGFRGGEPRLLAACLPGEQHEIGLLLFALGAREAGFGVVLLGADMPVAELAGAARRARCTAIVLSSSMAPPDGVLSGQLAALVSEAALPVFVGGDTSLGERDAILAAGARAVGKDIPAALRHIGEALRGA